MNIEIILAIFVGVIFAAIVFAPLRKLRHEFIVAEGFAGLLYQHGKFVEVLAPGHHIRWGRAFTVALSDVRKAALTVAGQEVLTADNIGVKLALVVTYQIIDPAKAAHDTQSWHNDLYTAAQLALRTAVGAVTAETLLTQRPDFAPQLLARVQPDAAKIGLIVHAVEVKDVMLPADLKRAFADTLKAKQEGQAALERARGESAALRNLANAARVLDDNPSLMNLRLMQSLGAAQGAGSTLVVGVPGGFMPLKNGSAPKRDGNDDAT